ncbi:MAG: NADP-dependent malic enzyme, partial [Pseudobdellovibrionaceae bacterium]
MSSNSTSKDKAPETNHTSNFTPLDLEALEFHKTGKPGKIEVIATKPTNTEKALSLAYSPGVAAPCRVIAKN